MFYCVLKRSLLLGALFLLSVSFAETSSSSAQSQSAVQSRIADSLAVPQSQSSSSANSLTSGFDTHVSWGEWNYGPGPRISQSPKAATSSSSIAASSSSASLPKWQTLPEMKAPWMKGERLDYELSWGFITAGYASLEVKPRNDGKVEFLTFATANKTVNKFYPVYDTVYTLVRKKGLMTDVFRKSLHEGTFHNKSLIRFDRNNKMAFLSDSVFKDPVRHIVKRSADTSVTIDGLEHSIMSAFYLVRSLPLKEGTTSRFAAVSGEKRYELKVIVHKREKIKTDLGEFNTVKVEPVLDGDGIFKSSGRIFIWFTDDEKRLPVLMQCEIKLGSIKAELTKVQ